jgi:hypothetical protein
MNKAFENVNLILQKNLNALSLSLKRLNKTYEICVKIGIKEVYTDDELDQFEVLTSRYARTVDLLVNKILRCLDVVEFIDGGSIIDMVNRTAKRGIIDSTSEIRSLKDLRNEIAHEYAPDNINSYFDAVIKYIPKLCAIIEKLNIYCKKNNYV